MGFSLDNRRKQVLIDKRYQLYYPITWILMVGFSLANFVCVNVLLSGSGAIGSESLEAALRIAAKVIAAVILLASAWMGFASVLHSHRIAGAMFNVSRTLGRVMDGDYTAEVRLRKEDFSAGLAEQINALIALVAASRGVPTPPGPAAAPQDPGEDTEQGQVEGN